jgi:hypothetical protein
MREDDMKRGRYPIEDVMELDRHIVASLESGVSSELTAVQNKCSINRVWYARKRVAEDNLAEELLPEVVDAVDRVLLGRCPTEVKYLILRKISRQIDPARALARHPRAGTPRMKALQAYLAKAKELKGGNNGNQEA